MCNQNDLDGANLSPVDETAEALDTNMMMVDGEDDDDDVQDVSHEQQQKPTSIVFSKDKMEDCILMLRDVFIAVDFDTALWDSLFATTTASKKMTCEQSFAGDGTTTISSDSTKPPLRMKQPSESTLTPFATISTLQSVLAFLEIDDSSIPSEYLAMEPASSGLELCMIHHPHLHDNLLQAITIMLLRITTELHSHHVAQQARSVQEHADMLNRAIQQLTLINRNQLPKQSQSLQQTQYQPLSQRPQRHQKHHHRQQIQLHRAVSATATCTAMGQTMSHATNHVSHSVTATSTTRQAASAAAVAASRNYY